MNTSSSSHDSFTITLHWLLALAIPALFCLGLYMRELPLSPDKLRYYSWHKWAGVTIFFLALARIAWHISRRRLPAPIGMPGWQRAAADAMHFLLYALLLAVPVSGWLMSSAKGVSTVYFGLWPLPDLVSRDATVGERLLTLHKWLNFSMAGLVLIHAAAALKHHWLDGDDILARMLPFLRVRSNDESMQ